MFTTFLLKFCLFINFPLIIGQSCYFTKPCIFEPSVKIRDLGNFGTTSVFSLSQDGMVCNCAQQTIFKQRLHKFHTVTGQATGQ